MELPTTHGLRHCRSVATFGRHHRTVIHPSTDGETNQCWKAKNLCFALQHGWYGITQPYHHSSRVQLTSSMAALVINHSTQYSIPTQQQLRENRNILKGRHSRGRKVNCRNWWKSSLQTGKYLYLERGASTWLTALSIENMGFTLHKTDIRDAVFLRYGWNPPFLPIYCVYGSALSEEHTLSCNRGAFFHSPS